jgi:hypothetical protein
MPVGEVKVAEAMALVVRSMGVVIEATGVQVEAVTAVTAKEEAVVAEETVAGACSHWLGCLQVPLFCFALLWILEARAAR